MPRRLVDAELFTLQWLLLIDLDASAWTDKIDRTREAKYYVGAKFSSGILPPEMIYCFLGQHISFSRKGKEYLQGAQSEYPMLWKKIEPKIS